VWKNRERGKLNPFKLGKILYEEYQKQDQTHNGIGKKYGLSRSMVTELIAVYENKDAILERLGVDESTIPIRKAFHVLRELKREQRGEPTEELETLRNRWSVNFCRFAIINDLPNSSIRKSNFVSDVD
jgi:hypothetical protein